jgi:hypothetical protein
LFHAAKRYGIARGVIAVDINLSGFDGSGVFQRCTDIACVDAGSEAIIAVVTDLNGQIQILNRNQA